MSEQIREQVSAFLDGELPSTETELLLKRLTRDAELRESFGRYALIGESMRGGQVRLSRGFAERVNRAIDGEPAVAVAPPSRATSRWWRPMAGAAVAASVAVVAVIALQQRAAVPGPDAAPLTAQNVVASQDAVAPQADGLGKVMEPASYTVPPAVPEAPRAMPAARLTNYVFAHSRYSSVMGQNDVLNDLLSTTDAEDSGSQKAADTTAAP